MKCNGCVYYKELLELTAVIQEFIRETYNKSARRKRHPVWDHIEMPDDWGDYSKERKDEEKDTD